MVTHSKGGGRAVKGKAVAKEMKANSPTIAFGLFDMVLRRTFKAPSFQQRSHVWHPWALVPELAIQWILNFSPVLREALSAL